MSGAYANVLGGKLKLKRASGDISVKKKKRKKRKRQPDAVDAESSNTPSPDESTKKRSVEIIPELFDDEETARNKRMQRRGDIDEEKNEVPETDIADEHDFMTEAEKKYERTRAKREEEEIQKSIRKTHRQKIDEFNTKLSELSEHYDIPKVGPG